MPFPDGNFKIRFVGGGVMTKDCNGCFGAAGDDCQKCQEAEESQKEEAQKLFEEVRHGKKMV